MNVPKIHESEYRFCLIMWEHQPVTATQLVKLCQEKLEWKRTTTYTVIKRLGERGVLKLENGIVTACPLAFGEVGVKERVKSVMNYRKPAFWVIVLALILCAILAASMLTDPIPENTPADIFSTLELEDVQWAQMTVWNTPAGEHIMLDNAQIEELVAILKSLDANDFKEKQGVHSVSVMVNCGEQEILIQTADDYVFFSFDAETAKILGDINWSIRSEELAAWVESIAYPGVVGATQWVDLVNPEAIWEIGTREISIPDFPEVTFRWTAGEITANEKVLIQGMPVWNAYFADLTGDGKPEICADVSFGSRMIDTHVVVYDYVNGQEYTLWDRGIFDYSLRLENGVLLCEQFTYPSGTPYDRTGFLAAGPLILVDAGGGEGKRLTIDSDEMKSCIVSIVDHAETEQILTASSFESFYEDEKYSYFFPSIRSHLVMVTYFDGSTEDIRTALEMGRATISDLDRFGINYHTMTKYLPLERTD